MTDAPHSGFPLFPLVIAVGVLLAGTGLLLAVWSTLRHRRRLLLVWGVATALYVFGWVAFLVRIASEVSFSL